MVYWLLSCVCILTLVLTVHFELRRTGRLVADPLGAFLIIVILQCVGPAIVTFGVLPMSDPGEATGLYIFDNIYLNADAASAAMVCVLMIGFIFFSCVGALSCRNFLARRFPETDEIRTMEISVRPLVLILMGGAVFTVFGFMAMGDSMLERYAHMVLLRSDALQIERTALTANALALSQAWSWLSVVALIAIWATKGRTVLWYACLVLLIAFALVGVSRRALFLPVVFGYLILVMHDGRSRFKALAIAAIVVLPLVAFGKEILGAISFGGGADIVGNVYSSVSRAVLRTSSDIGITVTESLGTLSMIDLPPRLGVDHLFSVAQRFPEGILGLDFEFPKRIVRVSTETFADDWTVDIPPGLMGQMWLDFRVFGPLVWGLVMGAQVGILQFLYERVRKSLHSAAVFFVLTFIVALPVNSGSFDFSFSVDIFLVIAILFLCTKVHRVPGDTTP